VVNFLPSTMCLPRYNYKLELRYNIRTSQYLEHWKENFGAKLWLEWPKIKYLHSFLLWTNYHPLRRYYSEVGGNGLTIHKFKRVLLIILGASKLAPNTLPFLRQNVCNIYHTLRSNSTRYCWNSISTTHFTNQSTNQPQDEMCHFL